MSRLTQQETHRGWDVSPGAQGLVPFLGSFYSWCLDEGLARVLDNPWPQDEVVEVAGCPRKLAGSRRPPRLTSLSRGAPMCWHRSKQRQGCPCLCLLVELGGRYQPT